MGYLKFIFDVMFDLIIMVALVGTCVVVVVEFGRMLFGG